MNEIVRKTSAAPCPICGKANEVAFKPFCSKRCADIDLNRWLSGVFSIPGAWASRKTAAATRGRSMRHAKHGLRRAFRPQSDASVPPRAAQLDTFRPFQYKAGRFAGGVARNSLADGKPR
jgi:endogenous inhibitor of DNA gyrase (YacG/DUF329 family)